ncbi:MAG: pyridoxal phosphate-dependent aminotransferase [Victivallales bacterium]|nr:pyridoxal phosphate-dependent aminotransferase [Victivallales bacterium]
MRVLSEQVSGYIQNSSFIRKMFENGIRLKAEFGADKVFDFSLGNPDLPPPEGVGRALRKVADNISEPFITGYMPNAGFPELRTKVAASVSKEQNTEIKASNLVLTCGAAGGINAFFRAVLEQGDEVICPAPYFVEYGFYVANYGGRLVPVKAKPFTFELDIEAMEAALTDNTRAILINSPNNPTGVIYSRNQLEQLAEVMRRHSKKTGKLIYLISDEPYRFLNYDNVEIPSVFDVYENSAVICSYSKSLSLAGARIGYVVVNPAMDGADELISGITLTNRILGFVNAPVIAQHILSEVLGSEVDMNIYKERRQAMAEVLDYAGIEYTMPGGAFYFFPKSPLDNDKLFCDKLMQNKVLAVPGSGFGYSGYFRLTFCVSKDVITRSAEAFKQTVDAL